MNRRSTPEGAEPKVDVKSSQNGTDAGSESRSKIYFDYAEQQGGKDREAGLKRKTSLSGERIGGVHCLL